LKGRGKKIAVMGESVRPYKITNKNQKRAGNMVQMIE
jgi:hypothetical protein